MYFRDGKLISKKSYDTSRKRKRSTRKGMRRKTARRAYTGNPKRRYNMKRMPHPSVSGLASLAILGGWINSKSGWTATQPNKDSVTGWLMEGNVEKAGRRLAENLKTTVTSTGGRKALVTSVLVATGGAVARKMIPNVKLGTDKWYLKI
jgi:ribosomal protein L4